MDCIEKSDFPQKALFNDFGIDFYRFLEALGAVFSDFLSLENRLEHRGIFGDVTDPEFWIWRGGSTCDLASELRKQHRLLAESMAANC